MLIPMIILTPIAAIFHKIAAIIAVLQFYVINFGGATRCTTYVCSRSRRFFI
jgi:hypothetical protein